MAKQNPLSLLELFFNSGLGRIHFNENGEMLIDEQNISLIPSDQLILTKIVVDCFLKELSKAGFSIDSKITELAALKAEEDLTKLPLLSRLITERLGGGFRFDSKSCESEVVLAAELLPVLTKFNRKRFAENVAIQLEKARPFLKAANIFLFWGIEYLKLTLGNKGEAIKKVFERGFNGKVLGFGDSRIDFSFLSLQPRNSCFEPYYLGDASDLENGFNIPIGPRKGPDGMFEILSAAYEEHRKKRSLLSAIIADVDNCTAPLDLSLEPKMAELLCKLLQDSVEVILITGGGLRSRYIERVIEPLKSTLLAPSS